jgi:benzoyl-CoA reductase/2-hydroxyglutaryl-CoA dehydratase subunit BcrC/BadD/HgdB
LPPTNSRSVSETALDELASAYRERDAAALEWKAQGGLVVGCLGSDVPEELLVAAGILPIRVCGDPEADLDTADRYIERAFDPRVRSIFMRIIEGSYSYLDHLVVSSSSDALVRVFYYLRALRRTDPTLAIPDLYFFDLLHTRYRTSALYNRDRARDLKRVIEAWCGRTITDTELAQAIATCEENRRLLRQLEEMRAPGPPRVSGAKSLIAIGSSMLMPRQQHSSLLISFLEGAQAGEPLSGVRLFVTGSPQDHLQFYELVESCGALVVGEDHEWGARHFAGEVDMTADPIDGIVDRYHLRDPGTHQATVSERVTALLRQVLASQSQGVISFIYEADDAPSWDFPEQKRALEAMGIPVLLLDRRPYGLEETDELRGQVESFVKSIAGDKPPTEGSDRQVTRCE